VSTELKVIAQRSTANYQLVIQNAVNLPETNATVQGIILRTTRGETIPISFQAQVDNIKTGALTPSSQEVGIDNNLVITFTTKNNIPKNGKIGL
jgi:hypothetical protein